MLNKMDFPVFTIQLQCVTSWQTGGRLLTEGVHRHGAGDCCVF